jgi:predicted nucleic acid-binding protein
MKLYCDTNYIIRYLLADHEEHFKKTSEIFHQAKTGKVLLIIEQTVFTEVIFVLSSFYKVPKIKISEVMSELLAYKGVICDDKDSLLLALNIYAKHNLHIVDSILLAKSQMHKLPLLTFDLKLDEFSNLPI